MPFLHGFRRIIYEYQPLVDAVLCVVGLEEGSSSVESSPENEDRLCDSLAVLLEKESQSAVFEEGISYALFKVSERGLACAAEVLLRYGADLNFEDPVSYYTPLHIAVLRNRPNMVRMLVQHGADVDKRDRIHESSPLDLASEELERLACMHMLLDMGADVNARDRNGKTALHHALASSDGLTVRNIDNIQLLLQKGADVHATTLDGETALSSLVFLVKEALDASTEDAAEIGRFCLRTSRLLLSHGADPSCCLGGGGDEDGGEPSLTQTSLEHFDLLFPLAVLLLRSGASFHCPRHGAPCWTGYSLVLRRLHASLEGCSEAGQEAELLEQAEVLLELAQASSPRLVLPACLELPEPGQDPHADSLLDLHGRVMELQASPAPLRNLCRAYIRGRLQPRALEERVGALPLPDRMKDFLLPKPPLCSQSGWDCFKPHSALR